MDSITKFERILGLVERVRRLDLLTADVMSKINQQQIELYRDINCAVVDDGREKSNVDASRAKSAAVGEFSYGKEYGKENAMAGKISNEEMLEYMMRTMEDLKRVKSSPVSEPSPPQEEPAPVPEKDLESLSKIRQMSASVAEHLKVQVDMHKYAAAAILETHKLSFDLFKEIDSYLNGQK